MDITYASLPRKIHIQQSIPATICCNMLNNKTRVKPIRAIVNYPDANSGAAYNIGLTEQELTTSLRIITSKARLELIVVLPNGIRFIRIEMCCIWTCYFCKRFYQCK